MKKTRVDKLIDLFKDIEKLETKEFCDRLWREHHIFISVSVPTQYLEGIQNDGRLIKKV